MLNPVTAKTVEKPADGAIKDAKKRYTAGVLKYRQMGYWDADYVPKDTGMHVYSSDHSSGRRRSHRGRGGRGRRIEHGHLDGGVDRPADRLRQLPGQSLQSRTRSQYPGPVFRLGGLRPDPVRGRLDRQHDGEPDRQRVRLQAAEGGPARGHPHPGGLREDVQGSTDRTHRRARTPG